MPIRILILLLAMILCVDQDVYSPSQYVPRYSLLRNEIRIEAGSISEVHPYDYILRNRQPLNDEEKENFDIASNVDLKVLGTYQIVYNNLYDLEVKVEDTTAPFLKLASLSLTLKEEFTWSEEAYASIIEELSDNYSSHEVLASSLACDSIDTNQIGTSEITCKVTDESGNETKTPLFVNVLSPSQVRIAVIDNKEGRESLGEPIRMPIANYSSDEIAQMQEVANLVNQRRSEHGLASVRLDFGNYHNVTYLRTQEVQELYSHTRPNGLHCFTIYQEYGLGYATSGENLAKGQQTPEQVVNDWMNSPTHRENILRPEFTILSVGVLGSGHQKIWVQEFFS